MSTVLRQNESGQELQLLEDEPKATSVETYEHSLTVKENSPTRTLKFACLPVPFTLNFNGLDRHFGMPLAAP